MYITNNFESAVYSGIEQCFAAHTVQESESSVTMLNNTVDNFEQCGQQNILPFYQHCNHSTVYHSQDLHNMGGSCSLVIK